MIMPEQAPNIRCASSEHSPKERPILFNGEMVCAILEGRKTQSRRIVAKEFWPRENDDLEMVARFPDMRFWALAQRHPRYGFNFYASSIEEIVREYMPSMCPFGAVGDRLWVRESFQPIWETTEPGDYSTGTGFAIRYPATDEVVEYHDARRDKITSACRPSIHMPRWASRITLEITNIRVERLMDISEADALAEGLKSYTKDGRVKKYGLDSWNQSWSNMHRDPRDAFQALWCSIYGDADFGCSGNPWVWVIEFNLVRP